MSFQSSPGAGAGRRTGAEPISERLARDLVLHLPYLSLAEARSYSIDRLPSNFSHTAARLLVFDADGNVRFEGHEFLGGRAAFWLKVGGDDRPPSWAPGADTRRFLP